MTCGATALCMLVIESRAYVFHVGDCKGYLFRNEVLYRLNIDHLPVIYIFKRRVGVIKEVEYKMLEGSSNMTG